MGEHPFTPEDLRLFAVELSNRALPEGRLAWLEEAAWLGERFELCLVEAAAALAFDPPDGAIDIGAIGMLIHARSWARRRIPGSAEAARTPQGDVEERMAEVAELFAAVEDAFEDVELPGD